MKIAFFIEHISNGGAERVLTNLANLFSDNGHSCIMITTLGRSDEYPLSPKIKRYVTEPNGYQNNGCLGTFKRFRRLREIIKLENPDYLVSFLNSALIHGVLTTRGLRTKSVISVRNDPNFDYPTFLSKIVAKIILPLSEGAVFQTTDAQKWFPQRLQRKSTIIFNPIGDSFFNLQYSPLDKSIIAVGRLNHQKNLSFLIRAFVKFHSSHKEWVLRIYGDGEQREELQSLINSVGMNKTILLCGRIVNVPKALSEASIYVMTSKFEGAPNALMEAMAIGMPCISSDCPCGGPGMLIKNGVNGFLYPVDNQELFLNQLSKLADNEHLRSKVGRQAKIKASEFTAAKVYTSWLNYLKMV